MRLSTINDALARRFQEVQDMDEARRIFESVFHKCVSHSDTTILSFLSNSHLEKALVSAGLPEGFDFEE